MGIPREIPGKIYVRKRECPFWKKPLDTDIYRVLQQGYRS